MEHEAFQFGLRARAAQLLTWFFGPQRPSQQPFIQSDRLTQDGVLRGLDDPDSRARALQTPAIMDTMRTPAEVLAQFQGVPRSGLTPSSGEPSQPRVTPVAMSEAPVLLGTLAARVVAMQQVLQGQQQARQRGQGMGF
jgi:hypothetical protein